MTISNAGQSTKYDLFLSYGSPDTPWVSTLYARLTKNATVAFLDEVAFEASDNFGRHLSDSADRTSMFVFVVSLSAMAALSVEPEAARFWAPHDPMKQRIVLVLLDDVALPDFFQGYQTIRAIDRDVDVAAQQILRALGKEPAVTLEIFLSYRRRDSPGRAGRVRDALVVRYGPAHVFYDLASVVGGADFAQAIRDAIRRSALVVAVIGPRWRRIGIWRRLTGRTDWVTQELAIARALRKPVIPVLVAGARAPDFAALPLTVRYLSDIQTTLLRDENWDGDVARLLDLVPVIAATPIRGDSESSARGRIAWWHFAFAAGMISLVLLTVLLVRGFPLRQCAAGSLEGDWQYIFLNYSNISEPIKDLTTVSLTQTGCSFASDRDFMNGLGSFPTHSVHGTVNGDMTLTRTDGGGCAAQLFGKASVAEGRMYWTIEKTDGHCGLRVDLLETRVFQRRPPTSPELDHSGSTDRRNGSGVGSPTDISTPIDKPASSPPEYQIYIRSAVGEVELRVDGKTHERFGAAEPHATTIRVSGGEHTLVAIDLRGRQWTSSPVRVDAQNPKGLWIIGR